MSIYATDWELKFPRYGEVHTGCEWIVVVGQGVPAHIGTPAPGHGYEAGDPYAAFLPPAILVPDEEDMTALRAMVIIRDGTTKRGQEYIEPLLVLTGKEYAQMPFSELHHRICRALRGKHPRVVSELMRADGSVRVTFADGSAQEVSRREKDES